LSLQLGDAPSEIMTRAQLAAMDEDWVQCGECVRRLREMNRRCIDHDTVYLPWRRQHKGEGEGAGRRDRGGEETVSGPDTR
jgi:hypothetical protein